MSISQYDDPRWNPPLNPTFGSPTGPEGPSLDPNRPTFTATGYGTPPGGTFGSRLGPSAGTEGYGGGGGIPGLSWLWYQLKKPFTHTPSTTNPDPNKPTTPSTTQQILGMTPEMIALITALLNRPKDANANNPALSSLNAAVPQLTAQLNALLQNDVQRPQQSDPLYRQRRRWSSARGGGLGAPGARARGDHGAGSGPSTPGTDSPPQDDPEGFPNTRTGDPMALANYDKTVYDTPVYKPPTFTGTTPPADWVHEALQPARGTGATTTKTGETGGGFGLDTDYGDFVTKPPLGTGTGDPKPPTGPPLTPITPPTTSPRRKKTTLTKPSLNIKDPVSVDAYLAYMGQQPGIDPTVRTDTAYWRNKILSGELGTDESYISGKMFGTGGGTGGSSGGGGSVDLSGFNIGNIFDDPATAGFMQLLQQRMGQLGQPITDPNAAILTQQITDALAHLNNMPSQVKDIPDLTGKFDDLIKAIQASTSATTGPTAQYRGILDDLVKQLSQPAFSDDQLAQLKTAAVDTLNHEHQTALANKTRAMAMSGIPPSSGIAQEALKEVDAQYQGLKAQSLQAQNKSEIEMINQRRQQLMQAASSSLTAAQQQAAQEQAALVAQMNVLMNQQQQAIDVRGQNIQLQNADLNRTTTGVTLAQALEQLSRGQRTEQNANFNQMLQLAGIPVDLSDKRLNSALQVLGLGSGTSPTNLLSALAQISQQATGANTLSTTNSLNYGKTLADIIALFNK
jgi:hypothetical protein